MFFGPFSVAIASPGEEGAGLGAFLDLSVSSSSWGLGRAAVCDCGTPLTFSYFFCDCGTPWTFLIPFFFIMH